MGGLYSITFAVVAGVFIMFLVISKTLNSLLNYLTRISFLINTEKEFRREELDVRYVLFDSFISDVDTGLDEDEKDANDYVDF